ncbi:uncharacterized protein LOC142337400 isoform X4 [Convolutriloba macropyga]|uniref:uncharacterized protein LOC142337400 isoform X4 n=1 Tax=Convolutriloba macropyga TaxID=536237 RepID=UPI003F51FDAE
MDSSKKSVNKSRNENNVFIVFTPKRLRGVPSEMKQDGEDGRVRLFQELPGTYYRVIKSYNPTLATHIQTDLPLEKGTLVEVLYVGDNGMLEGRVRDKIGWFPSSHVETSDHKGSAKFGTYRSGGLFGSKKSARRDGFPREVKLKRQKKMGYGFVIRGAMASVPNFIPTPEFPALQYFDSVDKGGSAEKAGLRPGDFILEFNGDDVRSITHSHLVERIKESVDGFTMKVMTPYRNSSAIINASLPKRTNNPTSPTGAPQPPQRNPNTSLSLNRIKSPSLDHLPLPTHKEASDEDSTPVNTSNRQAAYQNTPSSLQNLFQTTATDTTQNNNTSPNTTQPDGPDTPKPKLFQSARDSPRNKKKLGGSHIYSQSALNIRELSESNDSLQSSVSHREQNTYEREQKDFPHQQTNFASNQLSSNSTSSISSLSLTIPSSRNSTLIEEDDELQIAAIDSQKSPVTYTNVSYNQNANNHKPVIKSKSKDVIGPVSASNNSTLKSTFYNLSSKSKKPAPPPPPKRKKEKRVLDDSLNSSTSDFSSSNDLKTNLFMSELALSESNFNSENTNSLPVISSGNSSFKPKKSTQLQTYTSLSEINLDLDANKMTSNQQNLEEIVSKMVSKDTTTLYMAPETIITSQNFNTPSQRSSIASQRSSVASPAVGITSQASDITSSESIPAENPAIPSPDYSDSEAEDIEDDNTSTNSTIPEISDATAPIGSGLKSGSFDFESMQAARNEPLPELENEEECSDSELNMNTNIKLTKFTPKNENLQLRKSESEENVNDTLTYRIDKSIPSNDIEFQNSGRCENFQAFSTSSVLTSETQAVQSKPVSDFQGDLFAAINKRRSKIIDAESSKDSSFAVDEQVAQNSVPSVLSYDPGLSTVKLHISTHDDSPGPRQKSLSQQVSKTNTTEQPTKDTMTSRNSVPVTSQSPVLSMTSQRESFDTTSREPKIVTSQRCEPAIVSRNVSVVSADSNVEAEMGGSSGSMQSSNGDDIDVDALISQFYVPPPPEKLLEETNGTPSLTSSANQISLNDQGYESASASPDSTRSEKQPPVSVFLKHRQTTPNQLQQNPGVTTQFQASSTSSTQSNAVVTSNNKLVANREVRSGSSSSSSASSGNNSQTGQGEGDRQFTGRKSLTEILSEHENRSKTATNLNNTNTTSPNDQKNSNAQDFNSQLAAAVEKRNATAQEVLNKSNYPKSDRLLQLINQSVTPNKPSYLNTLGQQNNVGALPPKPQLHNRNANSTTTSATNQNTPTNTSSGNVTKPLNTGVPSFMMYPRHDNNKSGISSTSNNTSNSNKVSNNINTDQDQPLVSTPRFSLNYTNNSTRPFSYSAAQNNVANQSASSTSSPAIPAAPKPTNHNSPSPLRASSPSSSNSVTSSVKSASPTAHLAESSKQSTKPTINFEKHPNVVGGWNNSANSPTSTRASMAMDMQPVEQWDCDTVCEWLKSIKMSDYEEKFKSNDIVGSHLKMLSKDDLAELGVTSLGHRLTIERAIKQLP